MLASGMYQSPLCYARDWFINCETVQCRDLASAMRSALTTRSLADCAGLILKTVSMVMGYPYVFPES